MRISPYELPNVAPIIRTVRLPSDDDSKVYKAFSKLAIFWVIIGIGENFSVRPPNFALMISTVRLAENDDLEVSCSIL